MAGRVPTPQFEPPTSPTPPSPNWKQREADALKTQGRLIKSRFQWLIITVLLIPVFLAGGMTAMPLSGPFSLSEAKPFIAVALCAVAIVGVLIAKLRNLPPQKKVLGQRPVILLILLVSAFVVGFCLMFAMQKFKLR